VGVHSFGPTCTNIKCQPCDDKLPFNGRGQCHVTPFLNIEPSHSGNRWSKAF